MTICADCSNLMGKLKAEPPHSNQKLVTSESWSKKGGGMAKGALSTYRCNACKTVMQVDTDRHDSYAGWSLIQEG